MLKVLQYMIGMIIGENGFEFIAAAEQVREPLIGCRHILDTSSLLQQIYRAYSSV